MNVCIFTNCGSYNHYSCIKSGDKGLGNLGRLASIHRASKELSLGLTAVGLMLNTADY